MVVNMPRRSLSHWVIAIAVLLVGATAAIAQNKDPTDEITLLKAENKMLRDSIAARDKELVKLRTSVKRLQAIIDKTGSDTSPKTSVCRWAYCSRGRA
jgi:uncharacterized protein YlxW (UPF0749 family)